MDVLSMTGFGSAEAAGCKIEIKSVNHRHMDIYFRAPGYLSRFEMPFRNILKERFSRGKFDVAVQVSAQATADFTVNTEVVTRLTNTFRELQRSLQLPGELDITALLSLHGLFVETAQQVDEESLSATFRKAADDLLEMRRTEGAALAIAIRELTDTFSGLNERLKSFAGKMVAEVMSKFGERLKVLLDGREVESGRLLQEAAVVAARLDIAEELARIDSHIGQFRKNLSDGGPIGRRLDFILQELNREVNTVASKSADYEVTSLTVDMKTIIEKIREQVQNIE